MKGTNDIFRKIFISPIFFKNLLFIISTFILRCDCYYFFCMCFSLLTAFFNFLCVPVLSLQLVKWLLCQHINNKVLNCIIILISLSRIVRCCCPWPCQVGIREGGVEASLHSYLIWALNGGVLATSHLGRFPPK